MGATLGAVAGAMLPTAFYTMLGLGAAGPIAGGWFAANMGAGVAAGGWMAAVQGAAMTGPLAPVALSAAGIGALGYWASGFFTGKDDQDQESNTDL